MARTLQGKFRPKNPEKYKGNPVSIFYRSGWELQYFTLLDSSSLVVWWSSEEVVIPYYNPVKKKWSRYFPDIVMGIQKEFGVEVRCVEIKPHKQTLPPKPPVSGRTSRSYINQLQTYVINQSKWKYCEEFCSDKGWNFQILTEETNPEWKWKPKPLKPLKPIRKRKKPKG